MEIVNNKKPLTINIRKLNARKIYCGSVFPYHLNAPFHILLGKNELP
tara:strand:+ start:152 stop:292 length:141 start_codon:yes stop_codon:yes gene_type:complete